MSFSHTSGTHCGLWRGVIHSTGGLRDISHSEIYHREFDLVRDSPPGLYALIRARGAHLTGIR